MTTGLVSSLSDVAGFLEKHTKWPAAPFVFPEPVAAYKLLEDSSQ